MLSVHLSIAFLSISKNNQSKILNGKQRLHLQSVAVWQSEILSTTALPQIPETLQSTKGFELRFYVDLCCTCGVTA